MRIVLQQSIPFPNLTYLHEWDHKKRKTEHS